MRRSAARGAPSRLCAIISWPPCAPCVQNWVRSLLTLTGIVIGMLAIVTLIAILQGVKVEIRKQVEGLGTNLVMIVPGKLDENGQPNPGALAGISSLSEEDVEAVRRVPGVEKISPVYIVSGSIEGAAHKTASAFVVATNKIGVQMNPTPQSRRPLLRGRRTRRLHSGLPSAP